MKHLSIIAILVLSAAAVGGLFVWASKTNATQESAHVYEAENFYIELPEGLRAMEFPRDDGQHVFTFETADGKTGFQVFTMSVDEALPATAEKLHEGLPDMLIEKFQNTTVAGAPAITFYSHDGDIGDTFEVWFVHKGLLYQLMTYRPLDAWLTDILQMWKLK